MGKLHLIVSGLIIGMLFSAFQCSSTELTSAKLYIQQKNYDKALEVLEKEVSKNPRSDEGWYYLGVVQGEKGNYQKMIEAFDKSLSISNKFAEEIKNQRQYYWANLFNRGVDFYKRGVGAQNEDSAAVYFDKSIDAFEYSIQLEPDSADTYTNLAFVYMQVQRYDDAVAPLKMIIEKQKGLAGYKNLGQIYYEQGMNLKREYQSSGNVQDSIKAMQYFNDAIKVLEEGRKLYSNDPEILITLSNSYIAANKIDVAMDAFKSGVEQEPGNKLYRYNYGVLLLGAEKYAEAEEQFSKSLEIDPDYQNAIYNLAVTYVRWGAEINQQAQDQNVENQEYKRKFELALPLLEKLVEVDSNNPTNWELLGRVYSVLNMQEDAKAAFDKADQLR